MDWFLRTIHAQESITKGHICYVYMLFACEGCPYIRDCGLRLEG